VAAIGIAALPSAVSAAEGSQQTGQLTIEVVVTGGTGGTPSAVALLIEPNGQGDGKQTIGPFPGVTSQTLGVRFGAWIITSSVTDHAHVITSTVCDSQRGPGPNRADFIIDGNGSGDGVDARCVVDVTYTAPLSSSTTTVPGDTTTTVPGTTTTTIDQVALPATGGTSAGALPTGALPATGPTGQTTSIALTALGALLLGAGAMTVARRH